MRSDHRPLAARRVAVIDVGKTNVKLVLRDIEAMADIDVRTVPNVVRRDGPYPHYDTGAIFAFILDGLADFAGGDGFDAIVTTAHGASGVVVGESDLALPALDYEHDLSGAATDDYRRLRPDFAETFSPPMANGLNLGNQFFWMMRGFPEAFARGRHLLTYPQYWGWLLTGVAALEATSLGSHTDLWAPASGGFSSLVGKLGWGPMLPPVRSAFDVLGPLKPDFAKRIGLAEGAWIPVHNGIHDSNATLLPHLLERQAPFTVLSTGTWIVSFAVGVSPDGLRPGRDVLANVDAFGRPVPSSLFMGGREFEILTGGVVAEPDEATLGSVVERRIMALPGFAPGTGPFPSRQGGWTVDPDSLSAAERTAAASLYTALGSAASIDLIAAEGPTVVEGPFSRNRVFLSALAAVTGRDVVAASGSTGTSAGAALLARPPGGARGLFRDTVYRPEDAPALDAYVREWRRAAGAGRRAGAAPPNGVVPPVEGGLRVD